VVGLKLKSTSLNSFTSSDVTTVYFPLSRAETAAEGGHHSTFWTACAVASVYRYF